MDRLGFFLDKKLVCSASYADKFQRVENNLLHYDRTIILNGEESKERHISYHPRTFMNNYPIPLGIMREFADLAPYPKQWERNGFRFFKGNTVKEKVIFNPCFDLSQRHTTSFLTYPKAKLRQDFFIDWSHKDMQASSLISSNLGDSYFSKLTLYSHSSNIESELKIIYDSLIKKMGKPVAFWHKQFTGIGKLPDVLVSQFSKCFNVSALEQTFGEIIELGYDNRDGFPSKWYKIGFQTLKTGDTLWFEIVEDESDSIDIKYENEKFSIRKTIKSEMRVYR